MYLPVVLFGEYFLDDNYRSIYGYYNWTSDYRPLIDILYFILGGGGFLDIHPLPYILQFIVLSCFIYFFSLRIKELFYFKDYFLNYIILSLFFIFLQPFFYQNLYFRFDSIGMVFSIISILIPLVFKKKIFDSIFILTTLFLYQPAIIGYPVVICLRIINLIRKNECRSLIYKELFLSIINLFFSLIAFYFICQMLINANKYAANHFNWVSSFDGFIENLKHSLGVLLYSESYIDYSLIFALSIFSLTYLIYIFKKSTETIFFDIVFLSSGFVFVLLLSVININIFLEVPRLYSRTYVGFGFFIFFISLLSILLLDSGDIEKSIKKYFLFIKIVFLFLFLLFVNIGFANFNYFKIKNKKNVDIFNNIYYDLSMLRKTEFNYIIIGGYIQSTLQEEVFLKRYSVIKNNFSDYFNTDKHYVLYAYLKNYGYKFETYPVNSTVRINKYNRNLYKTPLISRKDYDIKIIDNDLYIYIKNENGSSILYLDKNRLK